MSVKAEHPFRRIIAWNTGAQLIGKAISSGAGLIVTLLVAGTYGASGYGDFVKITTYLAFFYLFADFGINAIALKLWKKNTDSPTQPVYATLLGLRVVMSTVLIIIAVGVLLFIPTGLDQGYTTFVKLGIIILSPAILAQALISTANAFFQYTLRYEIATIALLVGSVVSVTTLWVATQTVPPHQGVLYAIFAVGLGYFITAAIGISISWLMVKQKMILFDSNQLKKLFIASLPFGLTLIFNTVYFRIDSVILALFRSTEEVGVYGYVYKFFEVPLVIPTFFMNAVYPLLLRANRVEFRNLCIRSLAALLGIASITTACLWVAAPLIGIFRSEFIPGIQLYRVLILGMPLFFISSLLMWILIAKSMQMQLMIIYGTSMILAIFSCLVFVPTYGAMAAVWITVAGEAVVVLLSAICLWRMSYGEIKK